MDQTILGVDFSGAEDAGKKIWIALGKSDGNGLVIRDCRCLRDLEGGTPHRDASLHMLTNIISKNKDSVSGLDFPFSLPGSLIQEATWTDFILNFPNEFPDPETFREYYSQRARHLFGNPEIKRMTDVQTGTPWSPYNLRLFRQTYYGMSKVLYPLVTNNNVCIMPMQPYSSGKPVVIEICPRSTLTELGLDYSYKGSQEIHLVNRRKIIENLQKRHRVNIGQDLCEVLINNRGGDAIDSVIAALAVWRNAQKLDQNISAKQLLEGKVYV